MASSPKHLLETFHEDVPDALLNGVAKSIWLAYQDSAALCDELFLWQQAHDARGDLRRAMIERNLRNLVQRFQATSQAQEPNQTGSSYHTCIRANRIILTQSLAESPYHVVQNASFRKSYAEQSQFELFARADRPQIGDLYALILHGPEKGKGGKPSRPAFMTVVFPTNDCKSYVIGARIDLFARFAPLAQAIRHDRTEEIPDDLALQLRRIDHLAEEV